MRHQNRQKNRNKKFRGDIFSRELKSSYLHILHGQKQILFFNEEI